MPRISFSFSGWVSGANITQASDVEGNWVDVSEMSEAELVKKLANGELFISLGDHLYDSLDREIEIFDFEEM